MREAIESFLLFVLWIIICLLFAWCVVSAATVAGVMG